jgi:hypothetical protein
MLRGATADHDGGILAGAAQPEGLGPHGRALASGGASGLCVGEEGSHIGGCSDPPKKNAASPGKAGGAFVAGGRSRLGGGAAPRSPARPFGPYWVVLSRGRGAGLRTSVGRRRQAGSKREPDSRGSSVKIVGFFLRELRKGVSNVAAHPAAAASSFGASLKLAN